MRAFLFLGLCVFVWLGWRKFNKEYLHDAFSPLNLLFYFWILPLLASCMWLSNLQKPLSLEATLIIGSCTILLILTSLLPIFALGGKELSIQSSRDLNGLRRSRTFLLLFFLGTVTALYWAEFRDRDLPLILYFTGEATSSSLQAFGKDSKLQVLAYGTFVATMLCVYCGLYERSRVLKWIFISTAFIIVLLGLFKTSKSDVYTPLLICAAIYYYRNVAEQKKIPKLSIIWAVVAASLIASISTLRVEGVGLEGGYAAEIQFKYSEQLGDVLTPIVATIYGYTALGFQNFANVIARADDSWRLGTSLFRPFLSLFMQGDLARSLDLPVERWGVVSDAANVGTYLSGLYIEGGAFACLGGSLLYGLLVNGVYIRFRSKEGGMWMFVYIALLFPWTWLFFTNAFSVLTTFTNLVYIFLVFMWVRSLQGHDAAN